MASPVRVLFVAALCASPFAIHAALFQPRLLPLAAFATALQGYAAGLAVPVRHARGLGLALAAILAGCVSCFSPSALMAWPGILNAIVFSALLSRFARSLALGREPVITQIARLIRGPLPEDIQRYTRSVTIAWCVFFAGQLAMSALLLAILTRSQWLWFVTLFNLPLAAIMFIGEYTVRLIVLRHHRHDGPAGLLSAFGTVRAELAKGRLS